MSDFKEVYSVIVSYCTERKSVILNNCFEQIAREASIPLDELDHNLSSLQDFGLISYSIPENYIHLPVAGGKPRMLN